MTEFFLYTRRRCGLCDELRRDLDTLLLGRDYVCHQIEVDNDPELRDRYGASVPVLVATGRVLCTGQLDPDAVSAALR